MEFRVEIGDYQGAGDGTFTIWRSPSSEPFDGDDDAVDERASRQGLCQ